jgi:hypothetical protein
MTTTIINHHYHFGDNPTASINQPKPNVQTNKGPTGLRKFIGQKVRIKSVMFNEYLYTDHQVVTARDRWSVFCDRKDQPRDGRQFQWTITPVDLYSEGFALTNAWNTNLFTPTDRRFLRDVERRNVFVWIPLDDVDQTGEWVFKPVPNSDTSFYIKSKLRDEYLYPLDDGQYSGSGRPILTWTYVNAPTERQFEWIIELVE